MMRRWLLVLLISLSGCLNHPRPDAPIARHDFGDPAGRWPAGGIAIRQVKVEAAPWLDASAQLYRLQYATPLRRESFATSRWVAPPGELLERWLERVILPAQPGGVGGCRLVIMLDELEQRFTSPTASEVVLAVRANLLQGKRLVTSKAIEITRPASTPDSAGGVRATRAAVQALAEALAVWVGESRQLASACASS
ncbi:MAG: ABC-type transport auxiliary lipoprotein family protein [Pseudomonadota bacterium]